MSTSGGDTRFTWSADSGGVVAEAAKVDAAHAKMAATADKSAKTLSTAYRDVEVSTAKTSAAMKAAGDRFESTGRNAQKLAGFLSLVSPEAGEAARTVADFADVGEVASSMSGGLASKVGALTPIFAALAVGVVSFVGVMGDYTAGLKAAKEQQDQLRAAVVPLDAALAEARTENELLTQAQGAGKAELADYIATQKIAAEVNAKVNESLLGLRTEQGKLTAELRGYSDQTSLDARIAKDRLARIGEEIEGIRSKGRSLLTLTLANKDLEGALDKVDDGTKKTTKSTEEATSAEKLWAQALAESTLYNLEVSSAAAKRRAEIEKANAEVIARATEESAARQLEAEEVLRVRRIEIAEEQAAQYAKGIEDRKELDRQYTEAAVAVAQAALEVAGDIADAEYDKRASIIEQLQTRLTEGEETLTASQKKELKARIAANKEAAITAFNVAKAVAATQAAISTALAVANALATPVPYPVAVGFAVAAGIAGAATVGTILAEPPPKFHAGGEVSATLLPGEGVVNRQGMNSLGKEGLDALNHGGSAPAPTASFRVGRLEAKEIARTDIRSNGAIPQAIRTFVNRSSNGTGLSGRLAIR